MLPIHLLIPDAALADAVAEQLKIAELGALQNGDLPDQPPSDRLAIIIDEAAVDAKLTKKLHVLKTDKVIVLLLGSATLDETLVSEVLTKPIRLGHLVARLYFYAEVAPKLRSAPLAIGSFKLEAQQRNLKRNDEVIRLTEKETSLLEYLAQSPTPVGREELLAAVWGYTTVMDTHTLETHIYQLRRKIGSELILNEGGLYRLAK